MATAGDILTRLKEKLNDLGAVRWTEPEHFRAMNDGQQAILEARPDLFETYAFMATVAGCVQSVPADCYRLFDVVANCDSTNERVSPITKIERATLDRQRRGWMTLPASAEADHWMQDEREHGRFYIVPGQPTTGQGKLEIRYAQKPTTISSSGSALSVGDEAINALYNFCMHRALEKDEKFAGSPTAAAYMNKFAQFIGAKTEADSQFAKVRDKTEDA